VPTALTLGGGAKRAQKGRFTTADGGDGSDRGGVGV
jgi:hypothetical protein